jgi:hypothetical protein
MITYKKIRYFNKIKIKWYQKPLLKKLYKQIKMLKLKYSKTTNNRIKLKDQTKYGNLLRIYHKFKSKKIKQKI